MRNNWVEKNIGNLTTLIKDGTHGTHKDVEKGIPLLSAKDINNGKISIPEDCRRISETDFRKIHSTYQLQKDDVLLTLVGSIGRSAIINNYSLNFTLQRSVGILRFVDSLDKVYAFYYLNSSIFQNDLMLSVNASAQGGVYLGTLGKLKINYPENLAHQRKIAKILKTADAVIEKTEAAISKYRAIKEGMMQDLFTRGIDLQTGQLRPAYKDAPHLYKETELGWIPKEWECTELGKYSFITKLAGFEYTDHFDYSLGGEIIAVRALNLKKGKLDLTDIHTIPRETSQLLKRSQLRKGDLVISYVGTVGAIAVIDRDNKYHLAPNVAKITLNQSEINSFFLNEYLASEFGQKEIFRWISSTTQAALSMTNLRQLRVIKPNIFEQTKIFNVLKSLAQKIEMEEEHLAKHQSLKKGLMQDLLTGKVEVQV
ncbi:restriction endonuclease subunit S [Salegentibacter sp. F14]